MKQSIINLAFLASGGAAIFGVFLACIFSSLWLMIPAVLLAALCGHLSDKSTISNPNA